MKRKELIQELNLTIDAIRMIEVYLNINKSDTKNRIYNKIEQELIRDYVKKYKLPNNAVKISNSIDYVTPEGKIYKQKYKNSSLYFEAKSHRIHGYEYIGITLNDGKNITKRVHRIVAQTFIPNPNNLPVVGHMNNIKHCNNVENLYWTTTSENTKKAYDDGLAINDKGFDDSQSQAVDVYIKNTFYKTCGSITECSKELSIPKSTIIRRCKNETKTNYRRYKDYDFEYNTGSLTTNESISKEKAL